jgi:hypothetical protein
VNTAELIIHREKQNMMRLIMTYFVLFVFAAYFLYRSYTHISTVMLVLVALLTFFFLVVFAMFTFQVLSKKPMAVINDKGIYIPAFGVIPWQDIDEIRPFFANSIGISVKSNFDLNKRASIAGKLGLFWAKLFGCPPIILDNVSVKHDIVANLVQQMKSIQVSVK